MKMKSKKQAYRGCPLRRTVECFSFPPLPITVEELELTPEQLETYGVKPGQRLRWCTECENVWYESEHHFAHVIGKLDIPGGTFTPGDPKRSIYIG
jgi:hypothetical protein